MAKIARRALRFLFPWIVVFGLGVGTGFYVRDRQQHERLQDATEAVREQMEEAGLEAIDRARQAGSDLSAGAGAAADSARAAFQRLIQGDPNR